MKMNKKVKSQRIKAMITKKEKKMIIFIKLKIKKY